MIRRRPALVSHQSLDLRKSHPLDTVAGFRAYYLRRIELFAQLTFNAETSAERLGIVMRAVTSRTVSTMSVNMSLVQVHGTHARAYVGEGISGMIGALLAGWRGIRAWSGAQLAPGKLGVCT